MAGIGDITGTIEAGKCADMIVTEGNPLEDLRTLRTIDMVIARGGRIEHPRVKVRKQVEAELDHYLE